MKKAMIIGIMFALALNASAVFAKVTCTVDTIQGDKVTMTCKDADKLTVGDSVTVKSAKKKAMEGC